MRLLCAMLLGLLCPSVSGAADKVQSFSFRYAKHYQNEPHKPEPFATGTLTVTYPAVGSDLGTTPYSAQFAIGMVANGDDDYSEWGMANNSRTIYSFAHNENNGQWITESRARPDSYKPNFPGQQIGEWSCKRSVALGPTGAQPYKATLEMYVSCCGCNPALNIPPPRGYANLRVSITVKWTTDSNGIVTMSDVSDFQVEQSRQLDTGAPVYAERGDGGWDCGNGYGGNTVSFQRCDCQPCAYWASSCPRWGYRRCGGWRRNR
jgi:hypothetical protein